MNFKVCGEYFHPQPPAEWNFENMKKAHGLSNPMKAWGIVYQIIGALGFLFVTYKVIRKGFAALAIRSVMAATVTSIALFAIGNYFRKVAARHVAGLTEEKAIAIRLEEFKVRLEKLPICQTKEELEAKLAQDADFGINTALDLSLDIDHVYARYNPIKDLQPRFIIRDSLSMDQKLGLLDFAYEKGIVFEFGDYEVLFDKFPKSNTNFEKEYSSIIKKKVVEAFTCISHYVSRRLMEQKPLKLELLQNQINALGIKWGEGGNLKKVLKAPMYLEDRQTAVFRPNCSEVGPNFADVFEMIIPHVQCFKINGEGLLYLEQLYKRGNWENFKSDLNQKYPNKLMFIEEGMDRNIWQADIAPEFNLLTKEGRKVVGEKVKEIFVDANRRENLKKNEHPQQALA